MTKKIIIKGKKPRVKVVTPPISLIVDNYLNALASDAIRMRDIAASRALTEGEKKALGSTVRALQQLSEEKDKQEGARPTITDQQRAEFLRTINQVMPGLIPGDTGEPNDHQ